MFKSSVKPFIKWVGGKTQLLPELLKYIPASYGTYYEPFLGGAALFFALNPKKAVLSDSNSLLVNAYKNVRDNPAGIKLLLNELRVNKQTYYQQREFINEKVEKLDLEKAASFIYLNKTCFNGLWRENSSGKFNVPYGGDRNVNFYNEHGLMLCCAALKDKKILNQSYEDCKNTAKSGDLIYFDPPYAPINAQSFKKYTSKDFGEQDQINLRDLAEELKSRGCHVILSNSDVPFIRELYRSFDIHEVQARRSVNSKGDARGKIGELIIT